MAFEYRIIHSANSSYESFILQIVQRDNIVNILHNFAWYIYIYIYIYQGVN